ncbi:transposase [Listeria monocytogenes]|nr:transposase [Listeria monocytogenes]ECJ9745797.1 transposase [Listeria monocytogenes]
MKIGRKFHKSLCLKGCIKWIGYNSLYSFEIKLTIVHNYLSGQGGTPFLAKKYGFKDSSQIRKWINTYKELGEEGLHRRWKNKNYSVQFKLNAIELYFGMATLS